MPGGEEGEGAGSGVPDAVPTVAADGNGEGYRTLVPSGEGRRPSQPMPGMTQAGPAGKQPRQQNPPQHGETAKPTE
ncbi:MAG: hypothetical protein ACLTBV_14620 [Enterocloster bolteae]